jgi:hypothetical protein
VRDGDARRVPTDAYELGSRRGCRTANSAEENPHMLSDSRR